MVAGTEFLALNLLICAGDGDLWSENNGSSITGSLTLARCTVGIAVSGCRGAARCTVMTVGIVMARIVAGCGAVLCVALTIYEEWRFCCTRANENELVFRVAI